MGLSEKADRNWVEKNLNLAAQLSDGVKIYIPKIGEAQNSTTNVVQGISSNDNTVGSRSLVNVNSASLSDLDTLSGVGSATAQKIITIRFIVFYNQTNNYQDGQVIRLDTTLFSEPQFLVAIKNSLRVCQQARVFL